MNEDSRSAKLGTRLITQTLGATPAQLLSADRDGNPQGQLLELALAAALRLDAIHHALVEKAAYAATCLHRVADGQDEVDRRATNGLLRSLGSEIEVLAARRGESIQHLEVVLDAYQAKAITEATRSPGPNLTLDKRRSPTAPPVSRLSSSAPPTTRAGKSR
ncbi:hypothetical protein ACFY1P_09295 [Streptomyces sp. NPDC001407]|uniref:hypothetical protein n=1 Tax=Streptomyces sp. NPDC001407 TaxID=3364573 RepID=UPI0036B4C660